MPKFTFTRSAIVEETYVIDAADEADAWEQVRGGEAEPDASLFLDWATDDFALENSSDTPVK